MRSTLPRRRSWLISVLLLACFAGCNLGESSWGIPMYDYKQTHIQSLVAPKGTIRVWFDQPEIRGTIRRTGPDTGQINPSLEDQRPGFDYGQKLEDGRVLSFRCLTQDGAQGTIEFKLDGKPFPEDKPFQLTDGRLFLVTTRGKEITIQQLKREIRDAGNKAELDEVVKSDPTISAFVAKAEEAK